jgi:thioesterase domain-containing protein
VHGGEGSTLFLHRLAREMPEDQPFYGIEPEGLDGKKFRRSTIPQMAAHYLNEIRKVQPHGPYQISGYCFGGLVAFEMAQQLLTQGEPASLVALFSAPLRYNRRVPDPNTDNRNSTEMPLRKSRLGRLVFSPGQALQWRLRLLNRMVRQTLHQTTCKLFIAAGVPIPATLRTMYVVRMINQAEQRYIPQPYPEIITLFRGKGLYENDLNMGWDQLAKLQIFELGDGSLRSRRDIMNEPLVSLLAKQLCECLSHTSDEVELSKSETAKVPVTLPVSEPAR